MVEDSNPEHLAPLTEWERWNLSKILEEQRLLTAGVVAQYVMHRSDQLIAEASLVADPQNCTVLREEMAQLLARLQHDPNLPRPLSRAILTASYLSRRFIQQWKLDAKRARLEDRIIDAALFDDAAYGGKLLTQSLIIIEADNIVKNGGAIWSEGDILASNPEELFAKPTEEVYEPSGVGFLADAVESLGRVSNAVPNFRIRGFVELGATVIQHSYPQFYPYSEGILPK